jgi:hypothetical protein
MQDPRETLQELESTKKTILAEQAFYNPEDNFHQLFQAKLVLIDEEILKFSRQIDEADGWDFCDDKNAYPRSSANHRNSFHAPSTPPTSTEFNRVTSSVDVEEDTNNTVLVLRNDRIGSQELDDEPQDKPKKSCVVM